MILQRFRVQLITTMFIEDTKRSNAVLVFMNFMIFAYQQIQGFNFLSL
jgi:hypothetical protein